MKNNYISKIKRTVTAILPVDNQRNGNCIDCGECCRLPNECIFLKFKKDGTSYCSVHKIRPLNCRKYPRTNNEHITKQTSGFKF